MLQSAKLIELCLHHIPLGIIKSNWLSRASLKNEMEAIISHFKNFSKGFELNKNEVYVSIEAPKGEFGVFLVSNGLNTPYRCKIRSPGFVHLQGLNYLVKTHLVADVVVLIGTIDIVFGEIDR